MTTASPEASFVAAAGALGVELTPGQTDTFARLCRLLQDWNLRVNLTAITATDEVYAKHFLDSLTPVPHLPAGAGSLLDIGSGGGFPGLPIAIALPHLKVTLLESHARKTAFLAAAAEALDLPNVGVVTGRAEAAAHDQLYREAFDVTITRAVDTLAVLTEYQLPFCRIGGMAIAMKKGDIGPEVAGAAHALEVLGGRLRAVAPVPAAVLGEVRSLVLIDKVAGTPSAYPRRPGMPAKRPL